jgi:hypothetical protein
MNPKKTLLDLTFVGEVSSKRQTYYVYESSKWYLLMTVSRSKQNSFNFNLVAKDAVIYVKSIFSGRRKISTADVAKESKKPIFVKNAFDALNILYALCALGDVTIDRRFKGLTLYFNFKRDRP